VAIGFFMRKRAASQQHGAARAGVMQYTPAGAGPGGGKPTPAYEVAMPVGGGSGIGAALGAGAIQGKRIPDDFDVAGFERNAKVNFIRLQAAHDASNLDDIREFTTPEMFAELKMELAERGESTQTTDVVSLHAVVLEVDEDPQRYLVSVRFTGAIRADSTEPDEVFDEVWHLTKSRQSNSGWVLAGIQQTGN